MNGRGEGEVGGSFCASHLATQFCESFGLSSINTIRVHNKKGYDNKVEKSKIRTMYLEVGEATTDGSRGPWKLPRATDDGERQSDT